MKKILLGTLAVCSLAAVSMANTQFNMLASKLAPGTVIEDVTCTAEVFFDGVSQGRIPANLVSFGGGPLMVKFVFSYDDVYEVEMIDNGVDVRLGRLDVDVCGQSYHHYSGTNPADYNTRRWVYNLGLPPFTLPTTMVMSNAPQFNPCSTPPVCQVTPNFIDFGTIIPNTPFFATFDICNVGGDVLVGSVVENCPTFSIVSGGDYALAAGACQTVTVQFLGTHAGETVCDLLVGDCTVALHVNDLVAATEQPAVFALAEAYPNPFNPSTTLTYSVANNEEVTLNVYNTNGQLVRTLVNGMVERGEHKVMFDASDLASGVYVYTLKTASQSAMHKMVLVK